MCLTYVILASLSAFLSDELLGVTLHDFLSLCWTFFFYGVRFVSQHLVHLPFLTVYRSRRTLPPFYTTRRLEAFTPYSEFGLLPLCFTDCGRNFCLSWIGCHSGAIQSPRRTCPKPCETCFVESALRSALLVDPIRPHPPGELLL